MLDAFVDLALKFDGDNELEVLNHFKKEYAVCLDERFERYMFGTISLAENERICKGLNELFIEYVADIIDTNGQTTLQFRSGESRAIENGSWIINCTGYLQPTDRTYEPYLSTHGTVVSVQATSAIQILTSMSAYYLVHMFFLDQLEELPLYELDYNALMKKNKTLLPFAGISHTLYNLLVMIDAVPAQVMSKISSECGLDFNRWYPRHRMIISAIKLMSNGHKKSQRLKKALDRLQVKHGINCGLLERH